MPCSKSQPSTAAAPAGIKSSESRSSTVKTLEAEDKNNKASRCAGRRKRSSTRASYKTGSNLDKWADNASVNIKPIIGARKYKPVYVHVPLTGKVGRKGPKYEYDPNLRDPSKVCAWNRKSLVRPPSAVSYVGYEEALEHIVENVYGGPSTWEREIEKYGPNIAPLQYKLTADVTNALDTQGGWKDNAKDTVGERHHVTKHKVPVSGKVSDPCNKAKEYRLQFRRDHKFPPRTDQSIISAVSNYQHVHPAWHDRFTKAKTHIEWYETNMHCKSPEEAKNPIESRQKAMRHEAAALVRDCEQR